MNNWIYRKGDRKWGRGIFEEIWLRFFFKIDKRHQSIYKFEKLHRHQRTYNLIVIKLHKTKAKEENLKTAIKIRNITFKETRSTADFSTKTRMISS